MKAARFRETISELHKRLVDLTITKGEEYKRRDDEQFANFDRTGTELGLTREQVLLVFLAKHLNSVTTWVRDIAAGRKFDYAEPITGRIDDAILYLLILRGMVEDRENAHGRAIAAAIEAGGRDHPNYLDRERAPAPAVTGDPPRVFVIARNNAEAAAKCDELGVPRGIAALSAVDQLHGVRPPARVIVLHHGGSSDEALLAEVVERCKRQGLEHTVEFL